MGWLYLKTSRLGLPSDLPTLTSAGRAVLSVICEYAQDKEDGGGLIFVSQMTIAQSTGLSLSAVQKQVGLLSSYGYISITRKKIGDRGCKTMNFYRLLFPVNYECTKAHNVRIAKAHNVRIAKAHNVRPNRNDVSSYDDTYIEAGGRSAAFATREMVERVARKAGIPDLYVDFFCNHRLNLDLRVGQEGRIVDWWGREKYKERYLGMYASSSVDPNGVPRRRITEDDL